MPRIRNSAATKITFDLPRELRQEAEHACDEQDVTLAQLSRRGLRLAIAEALRENVVDVAVTRDENA